MEKFGIIPKGISIILIRQFPLSTTNNLVPEEVERYRIEYGQLNKAERSGPSWYTEEVEEQFPAKVETREEAVWLIFLMQLLLKSAM